MRRLVVLAMLMIGCSAAEKPAEPKPWTPPKAGAQVSLHAGIYDLGVREFGVSVIAEDGSETLLMIPVGTRAEVVKYDRSGQDRFPLVRLLDGPGAGKLARVAMVDIEPQMKLPSARP